MDPGVDAVVQAAALTRHFGRCRAVDRVTFSLFPGGCLAVFGPNGAGKTTLLRMLAGLLEPSEGSARVGGVTLPGGASARATVGLISHHSMLYPALTARENVEFAAKLHGLPQPREAAAHTLAALRVDSWADVPVRALSRGLQQRVSIARALVHRPKVVLLDEPFTGLDAVGSAALADTLAELKNAAVGLILVTHHLQEGLALATHVAVMRSGRFVRYEPREAIDGDAYAEGYLELAAAAQ